MRVKILESSAIYANPHKWHFSFGTFRKKLYLCKRKGFENTVTWKNFDGETPLAQILLSARRARASSRSGHGAVQPMGRLIIYTR
jgi:hypothetical protein